MSYCCGGLKHRVDLSDNQGRIFGLKTTGNGLRIRTITARVRFEFFIEFFPKTHQVLYGPAAQRCRIRRKLYVETVTGL